ncbi:MAG: MYG1 family protein [Verrucomicrobiota bacterium]
MNTKKIITHSGSAHKDDFLACCVLLASHPVPIERGEPTSKDLHDERIYVLDIGHEHKPELLNFDHHQFSKNSSPTCSLSLVLKHLGLYEDAKDFCEWLEPAEWLDCRGPKETAEWLGTPHDVITKLNSPIDMTLLRRFAAETWHEPGSAIWEIMRMIGEDLINYIQCLTQRLIFIEQHAELWPAELQNENNSKEFLFLPRTSPLPAEPSMGLGKFIQRKGLDKQVIGLVYPDRRGEGYGLSRHNDCLSLDFTRVANESDVHFAHARGFVAKTSALEKDRLKELMQMALLKLDSKPS